MQLSQAFIAVFATVAVQPPAAPPGLSDIESDRTLDVWMLDIGQGSCVYIDCPESADVVVVDCGSTRSGRSGSSADVAEWVNSQFSLDQTVTVILSHGDRDHVSLVNRLQPESIDVVRLGGRRSDYVGSANTWLEAVGGAGGDVELFAPNYFSADDQALSCGAASVDVLVASFLQAQPETRVDSRKNADSAIVRIHYNNLAVIMPGDAEGSTQNAAIANALAGGLQLDMPTVVMGSHHGARTAGSNNDTWVDALDPIVSAFSASIEVQFRHPQCEVVGRFETRARPTSASYAVPCGVGRLPEIRNVTGAVATTYSNGHVLFRVSGEGLSVYCERMTPACDFELDEENRPRLRR